ncbi:MAG: polyhydroxyalkanoate biosynthesis repressor PhaR [Bacteroidetes bacterium GWA2_31_9b]|nr:MAG: polyhydroxyalkanoate biosynthesis repressor PhaR [Bacteroidetes bacterium GWA2_31_9b]
MKTNPFFEIEGRKVGSEYDPLVIAELGINHNGSLQVAFEMVDAAHKAGVEIIKHQTHIVEDEMCKVAKNVIPGHTRESIYDIMQSCALSEEEEIELQRYVKSKGIIFISTPFSRAAANRLNKMKIPAYKIGSGECNNYPLIKHIATFGKPVILSTGMNSLETIKPAVEILRNNKIPFALLHCTNIYPTPPELIRLEAITQLKKEFPDAVVGLSDHSVTNYPCIASVALGASILERHFTDTMNRKGPDIICSMDQDTCKELIHATKIVRFARDGNKEPVDAEKPTIDFAFSCVVSIKPILAGEQFSYENIWVKRPGNGEIKAVHFESLIGKIASRAIENDTQLTWDDIKKH